MYVHVRAKMICGVFVLFLFFWWKRLTHLLLHTETTAQRYLWLNHRTVVKGIQIVSIIYMYTQRSAVVATFKTNLFPKRNQDAKRKWEQKNEGIVCPYQSDSKFYKLVLILVPKHAAVIFNL